MLFKTAFALLAICCSEGCSTWSASIALATSPMSSSSSEGCCLLLAVLKGARRRFASTQPAD